MQTTATTTSSSFERIVAESVTATIGNSESTMNSRAASSIGAFLLMLAKRYLPNEEHDRVFKNATEERRKKIINNVIDFHIESFYNFVLENKDKLGITKEKLEEIKSYLRAKFAEIQNQLDLATIFKEEGGEEQTVFPLRVVFALVCAATLDNEAYAAAGESENNRMCRVVTLVNTLIKLIKENRCHQGIRNDLAGTLNHVYPGAQFIENIDAFLHQFILERINRKLAEKSPIEQLQIIKEWIAHEGEHLDNFLNEIKKELQPEIEDELKRQGIDPKREDISEKIENSLSNLNYLEPPLDIHKNARVISNVLIFSVNYKKRHAELPLALKNAEELLNDTSDLTLDTIPQSILDLAAVAGAYAFYRENRWLLWGNETIINIGNELYQLCESYFSEPTDEKLREINNKSEQLKEYLKDINGEKTRSFIENFFIEYLINDLQQRGGIYIRLLKQRETVQMPDSLIEAIQHQIRANRGEVDSDSYLISRILLHAVLVSPAEWTEGFYNLLSIIVNFINSGLNLEEDNPNRTALINSLKDFLPEIRGFLMPLYVRTHPNVTGNAEFLPDVEMPILANLEGLQGDILDAYKNKIYLLQKIYQLNEDLLIGIFSFDNVFVVNFVSNFLNIKLSTVMRILPAEKLMEFLNSLGADFVQKIIKNDLLVLDILKIIPEKYRMEFLNLLGADFMQKIIKNDLLDILNMMPEKDRMKFLNLLGTVFLCEKIKNTIFLTFFLLKKIPAEDRMKFLKLLDDDVVRMEAKYQLLKILGAIPEEDRMEFLTRLDTNSVQKGIENDLLDILKIIPAEDRMEFLKLLGPDFLCRKTKGSMSSFLIYMPDKEVFLNFLNSNKLDGDLRRTTDSGLTGQCCIFKPVEQELVTKTKEDQTQKSRDVTTANSCT